MDDRLFHSADEATSRRLLTTALTLSLVVHALALWTPSYERSPFAFDTVTVNDRHAPLVTRIVPFEAESPPATSSAAPPIAAAPEKSPPLLTAKAASTLRAPAISARPSLPALPSPPVIAPLPSAPPVPEPRTTSNVAQAHADLSSYIASRRRARGEASEPASTATSGDEKLVSIESSATGERRNTGGLFQITHLGSDFAEFTFFGWHREIKRRATQRYEVRRGAESDIRVAVVRRMIAIIREYEQEDFEWRSNRLGRELTLSARPVHTAELEAFLMREFFGPVALAR